MYTKESKGHVLRNLCTLMFRLRSIEKKCDNIFIELLNFKNTKSLPPDKDINQLIESIEQSAKDMHEQSLEHRRYVERCVGISPMSIKRNRR